MRDGSPVRAWDTWVDDRELRHMQDVRSIVGILFRLHTALLVTVLLAAVALGRVVAGEEIAARLATIARQRSLRIELRSLVRDIAPFEQAADSELVRLAERLTGHRAEAVAFATEAPFLQALGMETIVMGPGSIDRAHQPDEYLELDQIQPCIALLQQCIRHYCL
mgnify:CR=1 FL=1